MEKYRQGLENIKQYLMNEGINVDEVIMWQGGFNHEGTPYGLEVIATIKNKEIKERYCVPKYLVKQTVEYKKYIKLE
jgi:hypothetical protein